MAAGDLMDAEWELVGPFLAREHGWPGQPRRDSRRMLDGILWRAREDVRWRALPERFLIPGPGSKDAGVPGQGIILSLTGLDLYLQPALRFLQVALGAGQTGQPVRPARGKRTKVKLAQAGDGEPGSGGWL